MRKIVMDECLLCYSQAGAGYINTAEFTKVRRTEGLEMTDLRWTRLLLTFWIVVVVAFGARVAAAATGDDAQPSGEKKVTLQLTNAPVIDAIDLIFKDTGYKYTIEPGVSGTISLGLKDVPFEQALKTIAQSAGLTYKVASGQYVIQPKPKEEEAPKPEETSVTAEAAAKPEEPTSKVETAANDQPTTPTAQPEEGPIFYGQSYADLYPPFPFAYSLGGPYTAVPYPIGPTGPMHLDVAPALPPPYLRSASLLRMLDQINAVHSIAGFGPTYNYYGYGW